MVALILEAALGLAAAFTDFLEVALEGGLLVEVALAGEPDIADMITIMWKVQYSPNVLIHQYCLSVAVLTFIVDRSLQRVDATRHVIQL